MWSTDAPFKTWCRDLKAERIESLIIILSNSDIESTLRPQGDFAPIVQATNIGCYAWEGSVDLTFQEDGRVEKQDWLTVRLMVKESGETCSTSLDNWKAAAFFLLLEPEKSYAQVSRDGKSYTLDASENPISFDFVTGTWSLTAKRE